MIKYRIYLLTTISFLTIYILLIAFVVSPIVSKITCIPLLDHKIELTQQEIKQVSVLSGGAIANKLDKQIVINNIQKAISGTNDESVFLSILDWSGEFVCYPDITSVGEKNDTKSNLISGIKSTITGKELFKYINKNKSKQESEVIAMQPIPNSDLIISAHLNLKKINSELNAINNQINMIFIVLGLVLLLFLLFLIRILSTKYEKIIDNKTTKLEDSFLNLSKLNTSLEQYQKSVSDLKTAPKTPVETTSNETTENTKIKETIDNPQKEVTKQRLLTYIRNELMSIAIDDIAYIYVENSISYVVRKDGKRFTTNDSLDQIYSFLDPKLFFRANRQTIVAIHSIDKIIKYGNSALKTVTKPASEIDIIIGKNKVALFKKWLDL